MRGGVYTSVRIGDEDHKPPLRCARNNISAEAHSERGPCDQPLTLLPAHTAPSHWPTRAMPRPHHATFTLAPQTRSSFVQPAKRVSWMNPSLLAPFLAAEQPAFGSFWLSQNSRQCVPAFYAWYHARRWSRRHQWHGGTNFYCGQSLGHLAVYQRDVHILGKWSGGKTGRK